jgi:perosamine synthetase
MIKEMSLPPGYLKRIKNIIPARDPKLRPSKKMARVIPVCEPCLGVNELKYVTEAVKTNWISSTGTKYIQRFEERFAKICSTKYAVSCSNGTAALHVALAALGIGKNDEVIVPDFTMIATANAVTYLQAKPVPIDAEPVTWNIDPQKIEERITARTKAIMVVHTYGHPARMDMILSLARKYKLYVVEDAAEAHGALYKGKAVGGLGDVGCFSFYANKIVTTGEGGMITTNSREIREKAFVLKNHAFSDERHFWHKFLGYNYRLTNLQAAIGVAQLERFEELLNKRIRNADYYSLLLKDVKGITLPPQEPEVRNVYWMYSILIEDDFGATRDQLRYSLARAGIETRTFFIPIHLQPIYYKSLKNRRFPISEQLCVKGMYLPSSSNLRRKEIEYIVECIKKAKAKKSFK